MNCDLIVGGLILNTAKVCKMKLPPPFRKGLYAEILRICKEEFIRTGQVPLDILYSKLKRKIPGVDAIHLMNCIQLYDNYRWQKKKDAMDYGQPYCPYPRQINERLVNLVIHKCEEEFNLYPSEGDEGSQSTVVHDPLQQQPF